MIRWHLMLVWLVVAAVPLQGLAAVSMRFCGPGPHHAAAQVAPLPGLETARSDDAGEHRSKANHVEGDEVRVKGAADAEGGSKPAVFHKCGVCASCCHIVAISSFIQLAVLAPIPQGDLAEPFVLIDLRPSQVPDKPPRA